MFFKYGSYQNLIASLSLGFLLYILFARQSHSDQWLYVNLLRPEIFFSLEVNPDSFGINDIRYDAEYCPQASKYICAKSAQFAFHVPRKLSKYLTTWNVDGNEYRVRNRQRITIFGISDTIYYIDRISSSKHKTQRIIRFLFSSSRGLVAMGGISKEGTSGLFLLDVRCGFGAPPECTENEKK